MTRLTTELMMDASQARFYWTECQDRSRWRKPPLTWEDAEPVCAAIDRLHELVKQFEREAWFGGMQAQAMACETHGMAGEWGGLKMLLYAIAGRCLITLTDSGGAEFTLITVDDEAPFARNKRIANPNPDHWGPMGIQHIDATEEQAAALVTQAREHWREFGLRSDEEVRVAGT